MKMMERIAKIVLGALTLTAVAPLYAQFDAEAPSVEWTTAVEKSGDDSFVVRFDGKIAEGWHTYDLHSGYSSTVIEYEPSEGIELQGEAYELLESQRTEDGEEGEYYSAAAFGQRVRLTAPKAVLRGMITWRSCQGGACRTPEEWEFAVELTAPAKAAPAAAAQQPTTPSADVAPSNATDVAVQPAAKDSQAEATDSADKAAIAEPAAEITAAEVASESESAGTPFDWALVVEAILWGFAALLTPCVFPMVPMTVSFFMKGSGSPAAGRFKAAMYGLFIVLLYTVPIAVIILITRLVGGSVVTADIFNWLATHWLPNIIFFAVFMVFAASFFGAFEITLPSALVNKSDKGADKGGLAGIFFMALTLVLVSFSCTGPIVGSVLIKSTSGEFWQPIITMLAFSLAFALPFTLFALFPSLLKNLPKSGGWLNSVKVVLGFIEVALGFKFLSTADQTYHWGLLDREVYLAIWIVVFTLLGLYLLGKLRFAHDDKLERISVTRLGMAIAVFTFVVYMIPGMWGAPLKAISGYLPPMHTQDFTMSAAAAAPAEHNTAAVKYGDSLSLPYGLTGYFTLEEGFAEAQRTGKPLFVDITGHGCPNCREMEMRVWSDERVLSILRNDYVIVALYTDDKAPVAESDRITTPEGKVLKTLGRINSHIVTTRFGVNAQPNYVLLSPSGEQLAPTRGYNLDVDAFVEFLESGLGR